MIVHPPSKTFIVSVEVEDGYGLIRDSLDAWDYMAMFDDLEVADLIGQRVRVILRPDRAQIVELMKAEAVTV